VGCALPRLRVSVRALLPRSESFRYAPPSAFVSRALRHRVWMHRRSRYLDDPTESTTPRMGATRSVDDTAGDGCAQIQVLYRTAVGDNLRIVASVVRGKIIFKKRRSESRRLRRLTLRSYDRLAGFVPPHGPGISLSIAISHGHFVESVSPRTFQLGFRLGIPERQIIHL
jgi:hypothetical protein